MRYLFIHQNAPGQFRHIAPRLAARAGNEVAFLTHPGKPVPKGLRPVFYRPHRDAKAETHHYLRSTENAVLHGQGVARVADKMRRSGWSPDIVVGHPGWGETLYIKDIWPRARLVSYCEFYYNARGADHDFDPEFPASFDGRLRNRTRNAPHLMALVAADALYAPTRWQAAQFPAPYRPGIEVIHDGIDMELTAPNPAARYTTRGGQRFAPGDPVITFVARNLEPYRGVHTFLRALPAFLERAPNAHVVIVGGEERGYGPLPPDGRSWKATLLAEVGPLPDRVHFEGRVPYAAYLDLLKVSAAHVYLTYPFVLSWSCLEAMASGCLLIGSATAPVEEVIADGRNGLLTDFFDPAALTERMLEALTDPARFAPLRRAARATVAERFALPDCLDRLDRLIHAG